MSNDETPVEQTSFNEATEPFAEPEQEKDCFDEAKCCGYPYPADTLPRDKALVEMFKVGLEAKLPTLEVGSLGGVPVISSRNNDEWVHDFHPELLPVPKRQKGCIGSFFDHKSFCAHFSEQKNETSRIYFNPNGDKVVAKAIFDENKSADSPRWREQFSCLTLQLDQEFIDWQCLVNKKEGITQRDLAEFLQDHDRSISTEYRDHIIESTKFFTTTKSVVYSGATDLENGDAQFSFAENTVAAGAGRAGTVEVPKEFKIEIAIFKGAAAYALPCRLRYRVTNEGIRFFPRIQNLQKAFDLAVEDVLTDMETLTGVKPFLGNP